MVEQEYTLSQMVKYVNVLIQGKLQSTVKFCRQNFEKSILSIHIRKQLQCIVRLRYYFTNEKIVQLKCTPKVKRVKSMLVTDVGDQMCW